MRSKKEPGVRLTSINYFYSFSILCHTPPFFWCARRNVTEEVVLAFFLLGFDAINWYLEVGAKSLLYCIKTPRSSTIINHLNYFKRLAAEQTAALGEILGRYWHLLNLASVADDLVDEEKYFFHMDEEGEVNQVGRSKRTNFSSGNLTSRPRLSLGGCSQDCRAEQVST